MAPVQRRVAAAADDKGKEKSGLSLRNIPTKKQVLMRLEHQLKDPSFLGVLIAWLPVAISGYAVYYGMQHQVEGVKRPEHPVHMMVVYNYLFKLCGALFPFIIIAIRIILIKTMLKSVAPDAEVINSSDKRLGFMYVGITLMRAFIYGITLISKGESMSDHILLGISIMGLARVEFHAALDLLTGDGARSLILKTEKPKEDGEEVKGSKFAFEPAIPKLGKYRLLFIIPLVLSGLVFVLTMVNNYNTARYYHSKNESMASILCATFFFEFPLSIWMMQSSDYSIFVLEIFKSNPKPKAVSGKELQEVAQ